MTTNQKKSYESLNHYFFPLFLWMIPFIAGSLMLIFAIRIDTWILLPLFLVLLLSSIIGMVLLLRKMKREYDLHSKKYGRKNYANYFWKNIWVRDVYGIIALLFLLVLLALVVFLM